MKHSLLYLFALISFCSCKKSFTDVSAPSFDVSVDSTTYNVNEDIVFHFTGNADIISFYSGAPGNEYQYKNRTTVEGIPQMQFTSYRQFGATGSLPDTTLKLLVSTNFSNIFDLENLQSATWTDISDRAKLSTGTDNTASGTIDLSDFNKVDTPVYIAFKYHDYKSAVSQRTWTIKNILVQIKLADNSMVSIGASANISWGQLSVLNSAKIWTFTTSQIQMAGGAIGTDDNEDWIITEPLHFNRVPRDVGVSLRSNPTAVLRDYIFNGYTKAGTYTVTFEAINANKWDNKQIIKELTITIK
jgi:hypothetical protein